MSDQPAANLEELFRDSGLLDSAKKIEDSLYELQWGSALVVVGIKGPALVIISPMFKGLPPGKEAAFCRRLLELNGTLGGVASFAIQPDGWVVLHSGRDTRGLDAGELGLLVSTVARQADHYDDVLLDEFYVTPEAQEAHDQPEAPEAHDQPEAPEAHDQQPPA
jgi:hypothetical protein